MKIAVEHEISYNKLWPDKCFGTSDFEGKEVCQYHKSIPTYKSQKRGIKEYAPTCRLFNKRLEGEHVRCEECKAAVSATLAVDEMMGGSKE